MRHPISVFLNSTTEKRKNSDCFCYDHERIESYRRIRIVKPVKLGLGTVAFAEQSGKHSLSVPLESVREILTLAHQLGIDLLDTAAEAGNSASVVGRCLPSQARFKMVVKPCLLSVDSGAVSYAEQLEQGAMEALALFEQSQMYALKVTMNATLMNRQGERLVQRMEALKKQELIQKTAFSVADPEALEWLLQYFQPDIVQLPINVLDQRFLHSGHLSRLKSRNIEVHARDILLQGVLLDPLHLHPWFWPLKKCMANYHDFLVTEGLTPLEGALNFVAALPEVNYAFIGVNSTDQLSELAAALMPGMAADDFFPFASTETRFVDPMQWNLYD